MNYQAGKINFIFYLWYVQKTVFLKNNQKKDKTVLNRFTDFSGHIRPRKTGKCSTYVVPYVMICIFYRLKCFTVADFGVST